MGVIALLHDLGWVATSQVIPHKFIILYENRAKKISADKIFENQVCEAIEQLWK